MSRFLREGLFAAMPASAYAFGVQDGEKNVNPSDQMEWGEVGMDFVLAVIPLWIAFYFIDKSSSAR